MSRPRLLIASLLLILAAGACQVRITGGVDMEPDGSGTVRAGVGLDAEALRVVGDIASVLQVDDLRAGGWKIDGPREEDDGLTWVRASRQVADTEEAEAALAALSGPGGPFRDLTISRSQTLVHNRTRLTGTVDLTGGLTGLSDADFLAKVGDGLPLDVDGLREEFGADLDRVVQVQFEAALPGSESGNTEDRDGDRLVWRAPMGASLPIEADSQALNLIPLAVLAVVLLAATGLGTGWFLLRRRR
ncbi:MAG: hypothetical protein ACR2HV_05440 [Acidimicrobiales bacterium]